MYPNNVSNPNRTDLHTMNICSKHFGTSCGLQMKNTNNFNSYYHTIGLLFPKHKKHQYYFVSAKSISHENRSFEMNCANLSAIVS